MYNNVYEVINYLADNLDLFRPIKEALLQKDEELKVLKLQVKQNKDVMNDLLEDMFKAALDKPSVSHDSDMPVMDIPADLSAEDMGLDEVLTTKENKTLIAEGEKQNE